MTVPWYLDCYKTPLYDDDMTEEEKKEAEKQACTYSFNPVPYPC